MASTRDRRPTRTRVTPTRVLGQRTTMTELLDPEVEGRVEYAHTGLSPRECDELRAKRDGTKFMPIEEAERLRRERPAKKLARQMDVGDTLVRLVEAATGKRPLDATGAERIADADEFKPKTASDDEIAFDNGDEA